MRNKIISFLLAFTLLLPCIATASAASISQPATEYSANAYALYEETEKYISTLGTPSVGSVGGEWMVIDLVRAGLPSQPHGSAPDPQGCNSF